MSDETKDLLRAVLEAVNLNSAKIDGLSDRVDRVEGRLVNVEGRIDGLETRIVGLETRMTNLENGQALLQADLESFRQETAANFRRMDRHMRLIEADLDVTIEKVHAFEVSKR